EAFATPRRAATASSMTTGGVGAGGRIRRTRASCARTRSFHGEIATQGFFPAPWPVASLVAGRLGGPDRRHRAAFPFRRSTGVQFHGPADRRGDDQARTGFRTGAAVGAAVGDFALAAYRGGGIGRPEIHRTSWLRPADLAQGRRRTPGGRGWPRRQHDQP